MKILSVVLSILILSSSMAYAVIPAGYDIFNWGNQVITDINLAMNKLERYYEDWGLLDQTTKDGLKSRVIAKIDEAITRLRELKTDINAL